MEPHVAYCDSLGSCSIGGLLSDYIKAHPSNTSVITEFFSGTLSIIDFFKLLILTIVILTVVFYLVRRLRTANAWDRVIIFRLGQFNRVVGPGLFFLIPFIDTIADWVDMRTDTTTLTAERTLTKDAVPVTVETVITWKVIDAKQAVLEVEDYVAMIKQIALISIREMIGKHDLTALMSEREVADRQLLQAIEKRVDAWGLKVTNVDIKDVQIPQELYDVMSRQAQAERERDARVTLADAEVEIAKKTVKAAEEYDACPTALKLRQMGLVYEMGKNGTTILVPTEMASSLANVAVTESLKLNA